MRLVLIGIALLLISVWLPILSWPYAGRVPMGMNSPLAAAVGSSIPADYLLLPESGFLGATSF